MLEGLESVDGFEQEELKSKLKGRVCMIKNYVGGNFG